MRGYRSEGLNLERPYAAKPPVTIAGANCTRETEKAVMVRVGQRDYWIPQSAIHADSEVWKLGDSGKLVAAHWWASRNGFK